jgi:hypothetical protein
MKKTSPPILESKPLSETILFNQQGVLIRAHINYVTEEVSFIDIDGKPSKYVFANRGIQYLGGWVQVFRALEAVTRECDKRLRDYEKIKDEKFLHELMQMSEIVGDE